MCLLEPVQFLVYYLLVSHASGCNSAVECMLPKHDVAGSNPVTRSTTPEVEPLDNMLDEQSQTWLNLNQTT